VLAAFILRPSRGPRSATPSSVAFAPTDHDGRWTVHYDHETVRPVRAMDNPDVTVSGMASDLYMWAWNRLDRDAVTIDGDISVIDNWRETIHVRRG